MAESSAAEVTSARISALRAGVAAVFILAIAAACLFIPLDNSYRALWYGAAMDACHVPLFALLTWLLVRFCWPQGQMWIIGAALAMACGAEIVQPLCGRSASWRDLAYGVAGVGIAAAWLQSKWPIFVRLALICVLAVWPAWKTVPVAVDAFRAWQSFPELADLHSALGRRRWLLDASEWSASPSGVQLSMAPSRRGSGAILLPVVRDWTGYERLEVDFAFEGEPLLFLISVRDGKKLPPELPRFDLWKRYFSGEHHVDINLRDLERGGNFPPIDLERVQSLHLVAVDARPRTVLIRRIRLVAPRLAASELQEQTLLNKGLARLAAF